MQHPPTELKRCLDNPGLCFDHPKDVIKTPAFNKAEKLAILQQWELDIRERLVAEEENMLDQAGEDDDYGALLSAIHKAIDKLSE